MSRPDRHRPARRPPGVPAGRVPLDGDELGAVADSLFAGPAPQRPAPEASAVAVARAGGPSAPSAPAARGPSAASPVPSAPAARGPSAASPGSSPHARRRPSPRAILLRERASDWLMLGGAGLLAISLFLTWSDQISPALRRALAGTVALQGVPTDPDAWQVYSIAGALLAILAAALAVVALAGRRRARLLAFPFVCLALAFVAHAVGHPPSDGTDLVAGALSPVRYAPNHPTSGAGEPLALLALGAALLGIVLAPPDPIA